ncbi:AAA family ATPase [Algivirga pacifica]|uniref:ATPase AAA-type core domain-containing protein n=1 Tax=Algivirga pacifica TaxID=1162670 RepID=A0ABP9D5R5_9BACT
MSELLKAFDSYNDFGRDAYFTLIYKELPSSLVFKTPLISSRENYQKVMDVLDLYNMGFELVFKNWSTEDSSNSDFMQDYPYELIFKGTSGKCLIYINLENDTFYIDFLYHCQDVALEKWVLDTNHMLRKSFGLKRAPTFKVLTKRHSDFNTEEVRTEQVALDLKQNYNDDFLEVHEEVQAAFEQQQSGLILFYGEPGTGKTTYIKHLITNFKNLNFIFVQNEFVNNLLDPDFITFLLKQRNAVLVIEDAEKVLKTREQVNEDSVVSTILQLTDGLFSDYLNIKVICTFNTSLSSIDGALLRKGRMIAKYEFKELTKEKTNELLSELGYTSQDTELTLSNIYGATQKEFKNKPKRGIGF